MDRIKERDEELLQRLANNEDRDPALRQIPLVWNALVRRDKHVISRRLPPPAATFHSSGP